MKNRSLKHLLTLTAVLLLLLSLGSAASADAADNSIELVSIDEVACDHLTYTVRLSVTDDFAQQGYSIGIQYGIQPYFEPQSGQNFHMTTDSNSNSSYVAYDGAVIQITRYSTNLISNMTYYIRPVLISSTAINHAPAVTGQMMSFSGPANDSGFTNMQLNQSYAMSSYNWNWLHGKFTAPTKGLYTLAGYGDFETIKYIRPNYNGNGTTGREQNNYSDPLTLTFYLNQGETVYLFAYSPSGTGRASIVPGDDVMPRLELNQPFSACNSTLLFVAPYAGWFDFGFEDGSTKCNINEMDIQTGKYSYVANNHYIKFLAAGQKAYIEPRFNKNEIGMHRIVVTMAMASDNDSIEVGDAFNLEPAYQRAQFMFTISTTESTAENGYQYGLIYGTGIDPNNWSSRVTWPLDYRMRSQTVHIGGNGGSFVPGMNVNYQAALFDRNGNIIARGQNILPLNMPDDLDGLTALEKSSSISWSDPNVRCFYYIAPTTGMYAVAATGMNSIRLTDKDGQALGGTGGLSSYLVGAYIEAGQRLYIHTNNSQGNACSLRVDDGTAVLPRLTADMPLQLESLAPVWFQAPEDGAYSFALNDPQGELLVVGEPVAGKDGGWQCFGSDYALQMRKNQCLWLRRSTPTDSSVILTGRRMDQFVLPAALIELEAEACAGMPIQEAVFGTGIQSIGRRAFADCENLKMVLIPAASITIAGDAFEAAMQVTLIAPGGGTVEAYARDHGIRFITMAP